MREMSAEEKYETILDGCRNGKILVVAACLIEANTIGQDLLKKAYTSCDGKSKHLFEVTLAFLRSCCTICFLCNSRYVLWKFVHRA